MNKNKKIGYFPADVIETITQINLLKTAGYSLSKIAQKERMQLREKCHYSGGENHEN
jgi:hypothetical protein